VAPVPWAVRQNEGGEGGRRVVLCVGSIRVRVEAFAASYQVELQRRGSFSGRELGSGSSVVRTVGDDIRWSDGEATHNR
jgi:hypothetical protein